MRLQAQIVPLYFERSTVRPGQTAAFGVHGIAMESPRRKSDRLTDPKASVSAAFTARHIAAGGMTLEACSDSLGVLE